jgi:uncharacterized DUF497 family protein
VFSWDAAKAIRNHEKHGVSFDEAATIFADPEALELGRRRTLAARGSSKTAGTLHCGAGLAGRLYEPEAEKCD